MVLLEAVTYMPKTACPYCKKTYEKAKHLENHLEKKHGRLVGFLLTAKSQIESGNQESDIQLPENPLDMTPDLLFKLSPGQALLWQRELSLYKSRAHMLNKVFSICGISPATSITYCLPTWCCLLTLMTSRGM
jgi:glutaredoxin